MFGGDGKPHRGRHEGQIDECYCRDRIEIVQAIRDSGKYQLAPEEIEPEKTPFPGVAEEIALPLSHLPLAIAETLEDWAWMLWQMVRRGVGSNGFGPASVTWGDLVAFEKFEGFAMTRLMVNLVFAVDHSFLQHYKPPGDPQAAQPKTRKARR